MVCEACKKRGYDVSVITSDFSHIRKTKRDMLPPGFIGIPTKPYFKNMSAERMLSHRRFAIDCFKKVEELDPDLIWLMAPANSLIKEANKYKKAHPDKKIVIDIIDMWPESLPVRINKGILPFRLWRNIRKHNINCADKLVTECDLYQVVLGKEYFGSIKTLYWSRQTKIEKVEVNLPNKLSLCYIGSINNIIDSERIAALLSGFQQPVTFHVIGEGESTESFLKTISNVCELQYHGPIRDEKKKAEIFAKCHAGINIYKEGLYIGLTVKCIDYFEHGLPIINNIKGDTWKLVKDYKAGINVVENTIVDGNNLIEMRKNNQNIYKLFKENFSKETFIENCLEVIDEVVA